jgi:curved DNA-binding protein CbpA
MERSFPGIDYVAADGRARQAITKLSGVATRDFYDVLGVPEDSTAEAIKAVYRQLARTFHPDVNADPAAVEHFREITEAFLVLSDPAERSAYDQRRRRRRRAIGEETEMHVGLRVAGIDLGGLLGVSVRVQRRPLLADGPEEEAPTPAALRSRRR